MISSRHIIMRERRDSQFTYETGELAMQSKAKTSLERAEAFNREISKVIGKFK